MSTEVHNPSPDREIRANIYGVDYTIPAGDSIPVDDPRVVTTLVEYGAKVPAREEYEAAVELHAEANREVNSRVASASSSEGQILGRQATVDVESQVVTGAPAAPVEPVELKGQALDDALDARGLAKSGTADEKRARVAEHDAAQAAPLPAPGDAGADSDLTPSVEWELDENGDLVLDEDGNPVPAPSDAATEPGGEANHDDDGDSA